MDEEEIQFELLQPWSTFVMKTKLPPSILEKMIRITDEIIKNKPGRQQQRTEPDYWIEWKILEEELLKFFSDVCRNFIVQAFCQNDPYNKEKIVKEEWLIRLTTMWINSQRDNEYFPIHQHSNCALSTAMYLKIPEYLPSRKALGGLDDDGAIVFINNASGVERDFIWGIPTMTILPEVGDFFIFPATQRHQVYPFRTANGKGERRSVSFNAQFSSKTEQDYLKKKEKYG